MQRLLLAGLFTLGLLPWSPATFTPTLQVAGMSFDDLAISSALQVQSVTVNDPLFDQQSTLRQIKIPQAWNTSSGTTAPIAIIDTGIDLLHEDLVNKLWVNSDEIADNHIDDDHNGYIDDINGYNFVDQNTDLVDTHGHGTGVTSVIAARTNNGLGMTGIAWSSPIMILKALNSLGGGDFATVAEAVRYAVNNGAKLINMSFGAHENFATLNDAINEATRQQVVIVAAVGNNYRSEIFYPAAYPSVIAVSSIDASGELSSFSNYGAGVDIAAPGEQVIIAGSSANHSSRYLTVSGSSFAAAEVTGVVALLLGRQPNLTPAQVSNILAATADPLSGDKSGNYFGAGQINAAKAVTYRPVNLFADVSATIAQPLADGLSSTIVTIRVVDESGQPQPGLVLSLSLSGNNNIVNNQLLPSGNQLPLNPTSSNGQVSFLLASSLPETKQFTLTAGASPLVLRGKTGITFRALIAPRYAMQWLSQSPSVTMEVGSTAELQVDIRNVGNIAWVSDTQAAAGRGSLRLGTARPLDRTSPFYDPQTWPLSNRVASISPDIIRPGETARFVFQLRASQAGQFREYFRPVIDQVRWLNDLGIYWDITVTPSSLSSPLPSNNPTTS